MQGSGFLVGFHPDISRHARAGASTALVIWLGEIVDLNYISERDHAGDSFPVSAATGTLKMTVQVADGSDNIIRSRIFTDVPVTRNRITTWRGRFFDDTDTGEFTQTTFGFTVNGEWDGEDVHDF